MALRLGCRHVSASSGSGPRSWPKGFLLSPRARGRLSQPDLTRTKIPSRVGSLSGLSGLREFPRRHELLDDLVRYARPVFLHALDLVTGRPHPQAAIARGRPSHAGPQRDRRLRTWWAWTSGVRTDTSFAFTSPVSILPDWYLINR